MPYIKRLVMHGFKSFPSTTEIIFDNNMNIIVGPNGSGKSNIPDAICFVLGRASAKSLRAEKTSHLLFAGTKTHKPSGEASVELIFDNSDKAFTLENQEISIKRILRRNGTSIYKINHETKTRQELLELLAQAGIDPNGFNIVLQGEIASLIKLPPEERRKIVEEVAGISFYEARKEKSIRELEKTDERLKEIALTLRERNTLLRNLEKEKEDALNFQKFEETVKKCNASILHRKIKEKDKEISNVNDSIDINQKEIDKIKHKISQKIKEIEELKKKIEKIDKTVQKETNNEQEILHREISELNIELAGLKVRKENLESRIAENEQKKSDLSEKIKELEKAISEVKISSPEIKKHQSQFKEYQEKFDVLEKERRKYYNLKSELSTLENRKQQKERLLIEFRKEVEIIERTIFVSFEEIKYAKSIEKAELLKKETEEKIDSLRSNISLLEKRTLEFEKENAILNEKVIIEEKLKEEIANLDICPLCKSMVTKEHVKEVISNSNKIIENAKEKQEQNKKIKFETEEKIMGLKKELSELYEKSNEIDIDIVKIRNAEEKKNQIKKISENQNSSSEELKEINSKMHSLKLEFEKLKDVEERYDDARLKLQDLSFADIDLDTEIKVKQRELARLTTEIKSISIDKEDSEQELKIVSETINERTKSVERKDKEEKDLYEKFQKMFGEKNNLQDKQKVLETDNMGHNHEIRIFEDRINSLKITRAQLEATQESLKFDFKQFEGLETFSIPLEQIQERLQKSQERINEIGTVNMRALEMFDKVKAQCVEIEEKVATIEKEKLDIQRIIEEIDKKKKKSFMRTLEALNSYFTRNFSQLSRKGEVSLELENKEDPFAGGLDILMKVGRGKYFDIASLSGGEKTLVALSLIFAIQEYKPYPFYIFDEIDAALDKHNSERLSALLKQYMTAGQYVVITHNDALISESTILYGVSMQEGISKVISLKV